MPEEQEAPKPTKETLPGQNKDNIGHDAKTTPLPDDDWNWARTMGKSEEWIRSQASQTYKDRLSQVLGRLGITIKNKTQ